MSSVPNQENQILREQIARATDRLGELERHLRAANDELESLGARRDEYVLLENVCTSLEKLEELGVAELFWGPSAEGRTATHVSDVRARVADFDGHFLDIEQRRESILGEIKEGQDVLDVLEYDLSEIEAREYEQKNAWIVERDEIIEPNRPTVMPWSRKSEDDRRFRQSLSSSLAAALLLGIVIPFIDLPIPDLVEIPEVPERYANLIREQELPLPPPPVVEPPTEEAIPEPEPEPEPEPVVAEELAAEVPEAASESAPPAAEKPPEPEVRSAGILAFRDSFSSLASSRPAAQLGSEARINNAGDSAVGRTERAMITSQAPGSSGGINLASLSRDVGGGGGGQGIDGVEIGRVASSIGSGTGTSDRPRSSGAAAGRTDEEIQIVFDRYKASLYRLYNRELRNDPTLRGQLVLQLTIEPDGSVSFCVVQSSDMGAPTLEQQVSERVRTFDFGAKDVPAITILYPIDFLPAA